MNPNIWGGKETKNASDFGSLKINSLDFIKPEENRINESTSNKMFKGD